MSVSLPLRASRSPSYALTVIVPGLLSASVLLLILVGYMYGFEETQRLVWNSVEEGSVSIGEIVAVSIPTLFVLSVFLGEIANSFRRKVPLEFRMMIAQERREGLGERMSVGERVLADPLTIYLYTIRIYLSPIIYLGDELSDRSLLTPMTSEIHNRVKRIYEFDDEYTSYFTLGQRKQIRDLVKGGFIPELCRVTMIEESSLDASRDTHIQLYERFLSYMSGDESEKTKRRRRTYIFRQNLKWAIGFIVVGLILIAIYHFISIVSARMNPTYIVNSPWSGFTNMILVFIFVLLTYVSIAVGGYVTYFLVDAFFKRAGVEYMRSLVADFHMKRREEDPLYSVED
ncbi:MAG: hypothetical protein U5J64_09810 [Halobacteriales archaeon]|nr:hypothetical protein [Halobacteriales archaeon]